MAASVRDRAWRNIEERRWYGRHTGAAAYRHQHSRAQPSTTRRRTWLERYAAKLALEAYTKPLHTHSGIAGFEASKRLICCHSGHEPSKGLARSYQWYHVASNR